MHMSTTVKDMYALAVWPYDTGFLERGRGAQPELFQHDERLEIYVKKNAFPCVYFLVFVAIRM